MGNSYHQIENIASKYGTDNIFILGKGSSIDNADPSIFEAGVVININDSEKIFPGDIGIFHAPWVISSLRQSGFKCSVYVTNQDISNDAQVLPAEYIPQSVENNELVVKRFNDDSLVVEHVMLVSALKVARIIANIRMRRQHVFLVGFDFDASKGYSKSLDDLSEDNKGYQASIIQIQEHYLLMFSYILRESNILIYHVGNKSYSSLTYQELNRRFLSPTRLKHDQLPINAKLSVVERAGHENREALGSETSRRNVDNDRVIIIAELTTNHFGSTDRLSKMVLLAEEAGADYIKVQKRNVDTFYSRDQLESNFESPFGKTFGDYRRALELTTEQFQIVDDTCKKAGIGWFLSVLDLPSFEAIQTLRPGMIKLPSTISQHKKFLSEVAHRYNGDVVISTGLSDQQYEQFILNTFRNNKTLYLLQCTSAYPTPPEHCQIGVIHHYCDLSKEYPNVVPGYSSHDFGSIGSMLAVAAGAKMIEKHVKLGDAKWAHFDDVALDLNDDGFKKFVEDIRTSERMVGDGTKRINPSEHHKYWVNQE